MEVLCRDPCPGSCEPVNYYQPMMTLIAMVWFVREE